jgi:uncharacterized protein (DUF1330 family)
MAAYLIGELEVHDPAALDAYRAKAIPLVERHGGRPLALDATPVALEGRRPDSMIVIAFPDRAAIEALFASADYAPLARQRRAAARCRMIIVDGL